MLERLYACEVLYTDLYAGLQYYNIFTFLLGLQTTILSLHINQPAE